MKVIRGPWSKGVQICSPGGVQIRSPRAEADHWVFKSAVVSQGNLGTDVAGQVGTAAPVFDSASGVPVSDSARPVTLSCNTWVYPLVEGKDAKPLPLRVSSPVRIVVHAPPASWGWAAKSDRLYTGNQTAIPEVRGQAPRHYYYDGIQAAVPVLHRGSRGGSGTRDRDSGSGEGAIADTSEAQAAAQTVPAAEAMSRTLPPPLFPLSRQASGGHYDDSRKSLFHSSCMFRLRAP